MAQVPITLAALVLGDVVLPVGERGPRQPIDVPGVALARHRGVTSLLFGLNRGPEWGW